MRFVNKQTFIYLVVSACIAGVTTTFGARQRIEQMNQICSAYIGGSDLLEIRIRTLDSQNLLCVIN